MKYLLFVLVLIFSAHHHVSAQAESKDIIAPILLDKSVLSGVGLKKIDLKNEPDKKFYQRNLYRGKDISIYVVSTQTWNNKMENFAFDEFIYMYHGEAIVKPASGPAQIFYSGDYFFAPKGYTGEWEIKAGKNLHYELSVFATNRADSTKVSDNLDHELFDRSTLSGAYINLNSEGDYSKVLRAGLELTVKLNAEKPGDRKINIPAKEKMIQVLSGQITIVVDGNTQTFYAGDFFVIPKGMLGQWQSEGHGLVKWLSVEGSE